MSFDQPKDPQEKPKKGLSAEEERILRRNSEFLIQSLRSHTEVPPEDMESPMEFVHMITSLIEEYHTEILPRLPDLDDRLLEAGLKEAVEDARHALFRFIKRAHHLASMDAAEERNDSSEGMAGEKMLTEQEAELKEEILNTVAELMPYYDPESRFSTTTDTLSQLDYLLTQDYILYQPQMEAIRSLKLEDIYTNAVERAEEYLLSRLHVLANIKITDWDDGNILTMKNLYNKLAKYMLPNIRHRGREKAAAAVQNIMTQIQIGMSNHNIDFPPRKKTTEKGEEEDKSEK